MTLRRFAILVLLLTWSRVAPAQSVGNMLRDDFKNAAKDVVSIWASPFDASGRDWLLTGLAFAAAGAAMFADQSVSDWAIENKDASGFRALDPVRRGGVLFTGKYVVPPVAAAYLIGIATKNQDLRDFVMGCAAAWGAQSPLRKAIYRVVGRARPDTMPDDPQHWEFGPGDNWMMHSFPAGHFANALSCATYWNKRFRMGAAEPLIYAIAGAVGIGRLADGAHWTSDSVLGGVLGYAVGSEIARRSLARQVQRVGGAALNVSPSPDGLTMQMRWQF
jgi:hypothetical protein